MLAAVRHDLVSACDNDLVRMKEPTIIDVQPHPTEKATQPLSASVAGWAFVAVFGSYFCMYGFRKPFTAAAFAGSPVWGIEEKTLAGRGPGAGYALAKCLGVRVIAEMPPSGRARGIVRLIAIGELAWFSSAFHHDPWVQSGCSLTVSRWEWFSAWSSASSRADG